MADPHVITVATGLESGRKRYRKGESDMLRAAMLPARPLVVAAVLLTVAVPSGCRRDSAEPALLPAAASRVSRAPFGTVPGGPAIELFTLTNPGGVEVRAMTYGGIIVSLRVPDRRRQLDDIVLGFDTAAEYAAGHPYFGAIVGRYANRIANGRFVLDGKTYQLATNNGPNHLHGGVKGFDKVIWSGEPFQDDRGAGVVFTYTSGDGEEGYPGTVKARVTYTLTDRNELLFDYHATADRPTVINLSQHSYFNLAGQGSRDVLEHELQIHADRYTPVDDTLIPTGELAAVAGTPFDFRALTAIGARIGQDHVQLVRGRGYDHNYVLTRTGPDLQNAARVVERTTGRTLEVATTEPGVQFYSGNFLDGTITGKQGRVYRQRYGFCLETQHFPDSPNEPAFPSTVVGPGQEYRSRTVFRFGTEG
jgi:aldose 1-epimerase